MFYYHSYAPDIHQSLPGKHWSNDVRNPFSRDFAREIHITFTNGSCDIVNVRRTWFLANFLHRSGRLLHHPFLQEHNNPVTQVRNPFSSKIMIWKEKSINIIKDCYKKYKINLQTIVCSTIHVIAIKLLHFNILVKRSIYISTPFHVKLKIYQWDRNQQKRIIKWLKNDTNRLIP